MFNLPILRKYYTIVFVVILLCLAYLGYRNKLYNNHLTNYLGTYNDIRLVHCSYNKWLY